MDRYNYNMITHLEDVDDKWVADFISRNISTVFNNLNDEGKKGLFNEFKKLKDDAIFCHGDSVWVKEKLDYFMDKLHSLKITEREKRDITGIGIVMFKKLSKMKWRSDEYNLCKETDLEQAVVDLGFKFTKSEEDLLNEKTGGRQKKRTKRRRKRTRKRRKKKTKKKKKRRTKKKKKRRK